MDLIGFHRIVVFTVFIIGFSFGNEEIIHSLVEKVNAMEKRENLLTGEIAELKNIITSLQGKVTAQEKMNRAQEKTITTLADLLTLELPQSIQDNHTLSHVLMTRMRRLAIGDHDITPVAFSAFLQGDIHDVPAQHLVKMKLIKLNEGNAYNSNDGIFVCPKPGLYLFHWSGMATSGKYFYLNLMVNGLAYAQIHAVSSPSSQMSSNAALVRLNTGDHVLVETAGTISSLHGSYCSFSGVRLSD